MKRFSILLLASLGAMPGVQAGSFQLPTQGVRQTAMGGSGTANPWDVSTIFFNPGGLARLSGFQVQINGYFLRPAVRYAAPSPSNYYEDNIQKNSFPFALYVGGKIKDTDKLAYGLGIYTPFGSSIQWNEGWSGRFINQNISLSSVFFQPTVSYEINPKISVGAGFIYAVGSMEINKGVPVQDLNQEGHAKLAGKASGMGFTAGIQYQANENYAIGLSYRSGPKLSVKNGDATFTVPQSLAGMFPNTTFNTSLSLPDNITLGLSGKVMAGLTIQADIIYATWSKYKSLDIDFEQNTSSLKDASEPRKYKNTVAIRAGAQYEINEKLNVMIGGSYDPTPTSNEYLSPDAVDGNRIGLSAGLSYDINPKFNIAASVGYTNIAERKANYLPANFEGSYQVKSVSPALSISYKF